MEEEVQLYLDDAKERMENSIAHLERELIKIRAGKASPQMLDGVMVDYYGLLEPPIAEHFQNGFVNEARLYEMLCLGGFIKHK